jgi:hypothetical protein
MCDGSRSRTSPLPPRNADGDVLVMITKTAAVAINNQKKLEWGLSFGTKYHKRDKPRFAQ